MEWLSGWVKQVFAVCILTSVLVNIIPSDKYQRYIRLLGGCLLMFICVNPLAQLVSGEVKDGSGLIERYNSFIKIDELRNKMMYSVPEDNSYYENQVIEYIEQLCMQRGLLPSKTEVVIDWDTASETYGTLMQITVYASVSGKDTVNHNNRGVVIERINISKPLPDTEEFMNKSSELKKELSAYYEISEANVRVYRS